VPGKIWKSFVPSLSTGLAFSLRRKTLRLLVGAKPRAGAQPGRREVGTEPGGDAPAENSLWISYMSAETHFYMGDFQVFFALKAAKLYTKISILGTLGVFFALQAAK